MRIKTILTLISLIFLLAQPSDVSAKYVDGKIYLNDGSTVECMIRLPFLAIAKKIKIKDSEDGKSESIKSEDIDMILLTSNDKRVLIKRSKISRFTKNEGRKVWNKSIWLEVDQYCKNIKSYIAIAGYDVDKKGNLMVTVYDNMGQHFLQREGEEYPIGVGYIFLYKPITQKAFDKQRRNLLIKYFADDSGALNYFESKERVTEGEIREYVDSICVEIDE